MEWVMTDYDAFLDWMGGLPSRSMMFDFMEDRVIVVDELGDVCWCCGGMRLEQHFITWEGEDGGKLYDFTRTLCFPPYFGDPCHFALLGSDPEKKCPFKHSIDAVCNKTGAGPDAKAVLEEYLDDALKSVA